MRFNTIKIDNLGQNRPEGLTQLVTKKQIDSQVRAFATFLRASALYGEHCALLTIVPVISGAVPFYVDLVRQLGDKNLTEVFFVYSSRYGSERTLKAASERKLALAGDPKSLIGRRILIVDDVVETGDTLIAVRNALYQVICEEASKDPGADPAQPDIRTAVVCAKSENTKQKFDPDYCLFEVPNEWIAGYGLDGSTGRHRGLQWIGAVTDPSS